jgi:hypothetical protein
MNATEKARKRDEAQARSLRSQNERTMDKVLSGWGGGGVSPARDGSTQLRSAYQDVAPVDQEIAVGELTIATGSVWRQAPSPGRYVRTRGVKRG